YLEALDNNRSYFTQADIARFERYRFVIDDLTRAESVEPAYEIYAVFRKRFDERMDYVLNTLIYEDFDYTKEEYYETDRSKAPWPVNTEELEDLWRKIIKNQALSLKLA